MTKTPLNGRTLFLIATTSALLLFSLSRVISPPKKAETLKAGMAKPIMELAKNALKQSR